jgi:hypothetical protein
VEQSGQWDNEGHPHLSWLELYHAGLRSKKRCRPRQPERPGPAQDLCLLVVMVVMVVALMMMVPGSESRAGKHHQQQNGSENLFHETNLARVRSPEKMLDVMASNQERGRRALLEGTSEQVDVLKGHDFTGCGKDRLRKSTFGR